MKRAMITTSRAAAAIALVAGLALAAPFAEAGPRLSDTERVELREAWRAIRPTWREFVRFSASQSPGESGGESGAAGASGATKAFKASYEGFTLLSPSLSSDALREARRQFRQTRREKRKEFRKQWIEARANDLQQQEPAGASAAVANVPEPEPTLLEKEQARIPAVIQRLGGKESLGRYVPSYTINRYNYRTRKHGIVYPSTRTGVKDDILRDSSKAFKRHGPMDHKISWGMHYIPWEKIELLLSIADVATDAKAVNGVTVLTAEDGEDYHHLGAWMDHVGFFAQTGFAPGQRPESIPKKYDEFYVTYILGDESNSLPETKATYKGAVFGHDHGPGGIDELVRGSVELSYSPERVHSWAGDYYPGRIDAFITIDNHPKLKTIEAIAMPGREDGSFGRISATFENSKINGELRAKSYGHTHRGLNINLDFYGPNHEEVAGSFYASQDYNQLSQVFYGEEGFLVIGVLGAKRQP
ncbi:MAG: hypothetical protein GDA40_04620 [Rhodobacteraceae bacterium]|nr:hypothetical protein [Paracoccaceae bacterium]